MTHFLKVFRRKVIAQNKLGKYLKYAIGEIVLLVFEILIALNLNSWDAKKKSQRKINRYYAEIYKELQVNKRYIDTTCIEYSKYKVDISTRIINILDTRNVDSQDVLKAYIGEIAINYPLTPLEFITVDEFIDLKYLSHTQNDSIKNLFYTLKQFRTYNFQLLEKAEKFQREFIYPFMIKRMNYSRVVPSNMLLPVGGPKVEVKGLFDDLEFYNLVILNIETYMYFKTSFEYYKQHLEKMIAFFERNHLVTVEKETQ
jgi:hypothetical protein